MRKRRFHASVSIAFLFLSVLSICAGVSASPCQLPLEGDLNYDCRVDLDDLSRLAMFWLADLSGQGGAFLPDGVFVATAPWGGADFPDCGSLQAPCATISYGMDRAVMNAKAYVFVADGLYPEAVSVIGGVHLWGGFDPSTWVRRVPELRSTILSGAFSGTPHVKTLVANSIHVATEISGFRIQAGDAAAAGGNSYAVWIKDSDSSLILKENHIYPGRGGDGLDGEDGVGGIDGPDGAAGSGASDPLGTVLGGEWVGAAGSSGGDATAGGKGGRCGGGAFGIFMMNTAPTTNLPTIVDNTLYAGRGGNAGNGGFGGFGAETGVGGGGGGGAGGIACGIYVWNAMGSPTYAFTNTFAEAGTGGQGGKGGKSFVNSGTDGVAGAVLDYRD